MSQLKAEVNSQFVRRGFWIDRETGPVLGATITTSTATANVLLALVVILVTLAGDHLWNLLLFTVHQIRAARTTGDALFQQEQIMLRSLPIPATLLVDMGKVMWSWRSGRGSVRRTMLIMVSLIVFGIAALAAGLFCTRIFKLSSVPVLTISNSTACFVEGHQNVNLWYADIIHAAYTYAENCYGTNNTSSDCNVFVKSQIPLSQTRVPCPAPDPNICLGSEPSAIAIDSGLIDMNRMLGVNVAPANRVLFRKQTVYFPGRMTGHYSVLKATQAGADRLSDPLPGEEVFAYNLGATWYNTTVPSSNATFHYSTYASNLTEVYGMSMNTQYMVPISLQGFLTDIIPELFVDDADISLGMVQLNNVKSVAPINDPIFSSHQIEYCRSRASNCSSTPRPSAERVFYSADLPVGLLVGYQRYQLCLPDSAGRPIECTELAGRFSDDPSTWLSNANPIQEALIKLLDAVIEGFDLQMVGWIHSPYLRASQKVAGGYITSLDDDQWVIEATWLESWVWAAFQVAFAQHAIGPQSTDTTNPPLPPLDAAQRHLCDSQKVVKNGDFANINVFGLCFVVAVSATLIVSDLCLLKIIVFLSRYRKALCPRVHRWIQDGALQLQRRAYESEGFGPWQHMEKEVPVYVGGERLLPTFFNPHGIDVPMKATCSPDSFTFVSEFSRELPKGQDEREALS